MRLTSKGTAALVFSVLMFGFAVTIMLFAPVTFGWRLAAVALVLTSGVAVADSLRRFG